MTNLIIKFYDVQGNILHTMIINSSLSYSLDDIKQYAFYELNLCGFTDGVVDSWSYQVKERIDSVYEIENV